MLRNTHPSEEQSRGNSQHPWKHFPQGKDQTRGKIKDKENNENLQLKPIINPHRKKLDHNCNLLSQTFQILSKVHSCCLSKFHTLFLAFHMFEMAIANQSLRSVPYSYKVLCCMFLAMKYQEIYPVELAELARLLKVGYNLEDYRRHEKAILISNGFDMHAETIDRSLESQFSQSNFGKKEQMKGFYLLQLAMVSGKIYQKFANADILKAICNLVIKQSLVDKFSKEDESVTLIMRLIMEAKISDKNPDYLITKKYQQKRFECVAIEYF